MIPAASKVKVTDSNGKVTYLPALVGEARPGETFNSDRGFRLSLFSALQAASGCPGTQTQLGRSLVGRRVA